MGDSQPTVYLEDIDPTVKSTSKRERPDDGPQDRGSNTITPAPVKRQRTLGETFFGAQGKMKSSSMKGLKPSGGSTSSIVSDKATQPKTPASGLVKLNSIPFSMTFYLESLSDEEKRLLQLECEVMGKSWWVMYFFEYPFVTTFWRLVGIIRIKVLKDEIKKPYFLKLKKFLWDEGVRTPDDTPASVKIFPPREF